jgi:hypothetical protein
VPRAGALHAGFADSVCPPDVTIRGVGSERRLQRNNGSPDRSLGRYSPALNSAHSCRADTSARPLPSSHPRVVLDNAVQSRHKDGARTLNRARVLKKARGSFQELARAFAFAAFPKRIAHPSSRARDRLNPTNISDTASIPSAGSRHLNPSRSMPTPHRAQQSGFKNRAAHLPCQTAPDLQNYAEMEPRSHGWHAVHLR